MILAVMDPARGLMDAGGGMDGGANLLKKRRRSRIRS